MVRVSFCDFKRLKILGERCKTSRPTRLVCGLLLVVLCSTFLWNVFSWNNIKSIQYNINSWSKSNRETHRKTPRTRMILLWTTFFGVVDFHFGLGKTPFIKHNCELSDCEVTTDKSAVNTSDAIVFHIRNFNDLPLPSSRLPNQRWVFFLLESPVHTMLDLQDYSNVFNWTMTYRTDSDIYMPYGSFDQIQHNEQPIYTGVVNKTQMTLWLVSNCQTPSQREVYIKNLRKHIPVDIRGNCGQPCNETYPCETLEKDYKFEISFENSICLGYITEKFYRALKNGAVPIVYGGVGHELIAPPHSFIDAEKFSSPKELSDYLRILHRNDALYSEYHEWRRSYKVNVKTVKKAFCELCKKLHFDNETKTYPNIHQWWMEDGHCRPINVSQW